MAATYNGEVVTVLRPVDPGDPAFVVDGGEQLLIRKSDGTECVVAKKDVSDNGRVPETVQEEPTTRDHELIMPKPEDDESDTWEGVPVFTAPKAKSNVKAKAKKR